jgi:hypothetical protein
MRVTSTPNAGLRSYLAITKIGIDGFPRLGDHLERSQTHIIGANAGNDHQLLGISFRA